MKKQFINIGVFAIFLFSSMGAISQPSAKVERIKEVEELLEQMTLEEKVGQMAQITLDKFRKSTNPLKLDKEKLREGLVEYKIGSVLNTAKNRARTPEEWHYIVSTIQEIATEETRLGIPVVYGVDAIHGPTYTAGATFFPQQIGMGATWNRELVQKAAEITAYETRASSIPWNFSPVLDMGRDPRWPRIWETFGEDVYLNSELGVKMVNGYEGENNNVEDPTHVAACLKHFLGYGVPFSGKDRTPAWIPEMELRERHLPPFKAAIEAGAHSIMVNSGLINGIPTHADHYLLTEVLKGELGFEGVVLTDWADIGNLHGRDHVASTQKEAVKLAINAGVDMSMVPYSFDFCTRLIELVNEGEVPMSRINDAVRRILNMKHKLGLFETPETHYKDYPKFGSEEFQQVARQSASESVTLLKNKDHVLPLSKDAKILVTGPNANTMRSLNGGWSYSWQGDIADEFASDYATILEAIQNEAGEENVQFVPGVKYDMDGDFNEEIVGDLNKVTAAAADADYIILVIGENSYTEKPGDLHDLTLSENQIKLAQTAIETGKPIIAVLNEGRPRIIGDFVSGLDGLLQSYLPGNMGGVAVADVLFGDVNPSGKLPYTYPMHANTLMTYDYKPSEHQKKMAGLYDYESDFAIQFPFGYGLSYTEFDYSELQLSAQQISGDEPLEVSVKVANTGDRKGKEVVQLYTSDLYASVTPDVKRLRRFKKIEIAPGESKTVSFLLTADDLAFVNAQNKKVTEPGEFEVMIGDLKEKFQYTE